MLDAANAVAGVALGELRVDGGMTANELLMQFQADALGVPVVRPRVTETTALGAAFAAGLAVGFWPDQHELRERWTPDRRWEPQRGRALARARVRAVAQGGHALARLGRVAYRSIGLTIFAPGRGPVSAERPARATHV